MHAWTERARKSRTRDCGGLTYPTLNLFRARIHTHRVFNIVVLASQGIRHGIA